jgi:Class II flagellar assembly regulator
MQGVMAPQDIQGAAGALGLAATARPQQGAAPGGFRVGEQASAGSARGAPTEAAAPAALAGLLAVQEAEAEAARDRAARRRGKEMLDELSRLQRALLTGRLDPDRLRGLAALAADPADAANPALGAALRAVAIRARVELARLGAAARR